MAFSRLFRLAHATSALQIAAAEATPTTAIAAASPGQKEASLLCS
jgi:hypothetical protein|tara:strand:+ start:28777 stop:28911 length:135 start_codon:yes stop_codon:yes gene_type:complete